MLKKIGMAAIAALFATIALSAQPSKNSSNKGAPTSNKNAPIVLPTPHGQNNGEANATKPCSNPPSPHAPLTDPNWVLVIVGSVTCLVVGWQSFATAQSAKAAFLQIQMMKDKERARVEIKALGLELTRVSEEFWHIRATIELRNVGIGRAYVRLGEGDLVIAGDGISREPYQKTLDIVDGFIDPTGDPAKESFYFFQPDDADRSEYAQKICDGNFGLSITGFLEYETVGTRFHRDFNYAWVGHGSPLNIGARLLRSDDFAPKTDEDRISFGYWSPNFLWMTGRVGDNEEYEMDPPKKAKRQKAN
jgi:hypothetical protein